jgi:NitT/TauT family transport system permease protein
MNAPVTIVLVRPAAAAGARRAPGWLTRERVFAVLSPIALLLIWEGLSRAGVLDVRIFSAPTLVVGVMWRLLVDGELAKHTGQTLWRLLLGMVVGTVPGLLLGLTMGLFRTPRAVIGPIVSSIYPLPRVALFPLVLLIVGLNETSNVLMVALGPFFNMLIGTMAGVLNVDPIYLRVARSFNVNTGDLYFKVVFPAALPIILSSFRLSLGLGLLGVVAVEFLMSNNGLGYLIWHSWQILSLGDSMAGLVTAGLIGFVLFVLLDLVEKHLVPWTPPS